ncbi:MAG TPA: ABC transporter substrate-binding protein [Stellaceae bacterium]|nr:ABC transporter substrate-binding protein [Stellaceae bacterium]
MIRGIRPLFALSLVRLVLLTPAFAGSITDATGRRVEIPVKVERVLPAGQPAAAIVYALAPQKMLGWPRKPNAAGMTFLLPEVRALPEIGTLVREGKVNEAAIAAMKPDLIVDYGSLAPDYLEAAKQAQERTGVPYIVFEGALEKTPELLRLLGPALGATERGEALAAEAERMLALTRERAAARQRAGTIHFYYSRSDDGLSTATSAAHSTDVMRLLGLENVADGNPSALPQVTREQVVAWNPDVIFAPNPGFIKAFAEPEWQGVAAVTAKRVFAAPRPPFGWIDEPPSLNRLLGLLWMGRLLYPTAYPEDMREEARSFYRRFYQVEPSEAQLDGLLR